jgi:hypothetical protein
VSLQQEDTLVRRARREAAAALTLWLCAMIYSVGYSYAFGYGRSAEDLSFILWFPDWVFWGIIVPWTICGLGSIPFAFGFMGDEPLGAEIDADPAQEFELPGSAPHHEVHDE